MTARHHPRSLFNSSVASFPSAKSPLADADDNLPSFPDHDSHPIPSHPIPSRFYLFPSLDTLIPYDTIPRPLLLDFHRLLRRRLSLLFLTSLFFRTCLGSVLAQAGLAKVC
jgi:hypothetical protein